MAPPPAHTGDTHGTTPWSGCSTHSRRSCCILLWLSTSETPATRNGSFGFHASLKTHSYSVTQGSCLDSPRPGEKGPAQSVSAHSVPISRNLADNWPGHPASTAWPHSASPCPIPTPPWRPDSNSLPPEIKVKNEAVPGPRL